MFLPKRKTEEYAARHSDETHSSRRRLIGINELRGRWLTPDAARACKSRLHRRARDGRPRHGASQIRLAVLRSGPGNRKIRGCGSSGPARKRRSARAESGFVRENFRQSRDPRFRTPAQRPGCRRCSPVCPRIRRARRSLAPQGTHGRTFDRGARPARVPRRIPQRIWSDGSRALFRSPPRESAFFHAFGLAGSENQSRSFHFQSRQLPQTTESERPLGGLLQESPKPQRRRQTAEEVVASSARVHLIRQKCRSVLFLSCSEQSFSAEHVLQE